MTGEGLDLDLALELHKDRAEEVMAGAMMTEMIQVAAVAVEEEIAICHLESTREAKKWLHMTVVVAEGEAREWRVTARGLGEDLEHIPALLRRISIDLYRNLYADWHYEYCIANRASSKEFKGTRSYAFRSCKI